MGENFRQGSEFLPPSIDVPQELQGYEQFLVWKYAEVNGKIRKPPFSPETGTLASPTNPETWSSLQQAHEALRTGNYDGVGFVFSDNDPFAGIDLDHAIDGAGNLEAWTLPILATLSSYSEVSPSGTGLHILVRAELPHGRKIGKIEMYSRQRYFTLTGNHVANTPPTIEDRQNEAMLLYDLLTPKPEAREHVVYEAQRDDDAVLKRAIDEKHDALFERLYKGDTAGFTSKSNADFTFILKALYWTNQNKSQVRRLFLRSGLVDNKTLSPRGDTTYLDYSIEQAMKKGERRT